MVINKYTFSRKLVGFILISFLLVVVTLFLRLVSLIGH